jgi:hypothetical protein
MPPHLQTLTGFGGSYPYSHADEAMAALEAQKKKLSGAGLVILDAGLDTFTGGNFVNYDYHILFISPLKS